MNRKKEKESNKTSGPATLEPATFRSEAGVLPVFPWVEKEQFVGNCYSG